MHSAFELLNWAMMGVGVGHRMCMPQYVFQLLAPLGRLSSCPPAGAAFGLLFETRETYVAHSDCYICEHECSSIEHIPSCTSAKKPKWMHESQAANTSTEKVLEPCIVIVFKRIWMHTCL